MNAHHFIDDLKVQRFCLTLLEEARLWFQSLEPLENTTWPQLQNLFRQRYSKLGNTCEQLFHAWRSFNFGENTEPHRFLCHSNKTGNNTYRLWRARSIGSIQEHTSNKIVLGTISNRRHETSSRKQLREY